MILLDFKYFCNDHLAKAGKKFRTFLQQKKLGHSLIPILCSWSRQKRKGGLAAAF